MTLLNPGLLYGLLLAAAPVILHLLLRRKPKRLEFPALRLVQQRRKQNLKRMQLRHVWLLLLRILAIALVVLAVTRPSLPAADYTFSPSEWITLAAVVACAVGLYFWRLRGWRRQALPRHIFLLRRARARGWITGGALLGLLLLVGCPYQQRITAEIKAPPPVAELGLPVAAVLLFDSSLSMSYLRGGKNRLDVARHIATTHLSELPTGSRVSVVDTSNDNPVLFLQTLSAAQSRLSQLKPEALNISLSDRLRTCLLAQEEDRKRTLAEQGNIAEDVRKDRFLRRVYVFTDLTRTPWRLGSSLLKSEIERLQTVNVFVVDVGEMEPQNRAVLDVRLSRQQVSIGGQLAVSALVRADGDVSGTATVELRRLLPEGKSLPQGKAEAKLDDGASTLITFPLLTELNGPLFHGEVRFDASDPLAMDDVRYFTVELGEPPRVLVSAPTQAVADDWMTALAPPGYESKFRVAFAPSSRLRDADLAAFDVVHLINVPQLADGEWSRLATFVEQGGGLGLFLGSDAIKASAYDRAQAQAFLPARLEAVRLREDRRLSIEKVEHPVFRKLSDYDGIPILEQDVRINRYWVVSPASGAGVLANFSDEEASPALIERSFGKGRVAMFTSAVDGARGSFSRWNNLSNRTEIGWPFLAFAESLTLYLARSTDQVFNYVAGEDAVLSFPPSDSARTFLLKRPEYRQASLSLAPGEETLVVSEADDPGSYTLSDAEPPGEVVSGFSVNPAEAESDLTRLTPAELDELFGAGRYQVARSIGELDASINTADLGREVFSIVLLLAIVAFLGEHLVANRFYEADQDPASSSEATLPSRPGGQAAAPPTESPRPSGRSSASGHPDAVRSPS